MRVTWLYTGPDNESHFAELDVPMHAVTYGVSRDQMMARHKANHIQVAYAKSAREADLALYAKAALAAELGLEVSLCGTKADGGKF